MADGSSPSPLAEPSHALFGRDELMLLTVAVAAINAWNRIAGRLHFPPISQLAA